MTRQEFDQWIEAHYTELLAVAERRTRFEPEDVLQSAIAGMLASPDLARIRLDNEDRDPVLIAVWPWAVSWVRGKVSDARRAAQSRAALEAEVENVARLGERGKRHNPAPGADDQGENGGWGNSPRGWNRDN